MSEALESIDEPVPAPPAIRPRISLWQLFVVLTTICVGLGAYAWVGWFALGVWAICIWLLSAWYGGMNRREATISAILLLLFILFLLPLIPVTRDGYEGVRQCNNNLRQIHIALISYHYQHGSFPPIATYSESGRPMHSWRTLILLHIEREDLREVYDFSEPWDGPTNQQLHNEDIRLFRCPSVRRIPSSDVTYLAVIDPAAKPGDRFAVIEIPNSGLNYFEPRDITLAELQAGQTPDGKPILPRHDNQTGLHLLMPDGKVVRVTLQELPQKLKSPKTGK